MAIWLVDCTPSGVIFDVHYQWRSVMLDNLCLQFLSASEVEFFFAIWVPWKILARAPIYKVVRGRGESFYHACVECVLTVNVLTSQLKNKKTQPQRPILFKSCLCGLVQVREIHSSREFLQAIVKLNLSRPMQKIWLTLNLEKWEYLALPSAPYSSGKQQDIWLFIVQKFAKLWLSEDMALNKASI